MIMQILGILVLVFVVALLAIATIFGVLFLKEFIDDNRDTF